MSIVGVRVLAVNDAEQVIGGADYPHSEPLYLAALGQGRTSILGWIGGGETRLTRYMMHPFFEDLDSIVVPQEHRDVYDEVRRLADLVRSGRANSLRFLVD